MRNEIIALLANVTGRDRILVDEPMNKHTTYKIGGAADVMVEPENSKQLIEILKALKDKDIPFFVLGNGSNLLVGDKGIRGVVIKIANLMSDCQVNGECLVAECGIKLSRLANVALANNLTGLEFASGIPGTLGGAVFMNAGAYGGEMKDVIKEVTYIDTDSCELITVPASLCDFGYRHSVFSDKSVVLLSVTMKLNIGNSDSIKAKMNELNMRRAEKQPIDKPSAGSTFKRPEGYFAGTMIEECGLKGYKIGGAEVSQKHAGFVINAGGATAEDVKNLILHIQKTVDDRFGVRLEPEVRFVGEF